MWVTSFHAFLYFPIKANKEFVDSEMGSWKKLDSRTVFYCIYGF
jgi:hypothetical protein